MTAQRLEAQTSAVRPSKVCDIHSMNHGIIDSMSRTRISTTVDGAVLEQARALSGARDAEMFDAAMLALIEKIHGERELAALIEWPIGRDG